MDIVFELLKEKNNILFEKRNDILRKSDAWIAKAETVSNEIQKNLLLAESYYLRTSCNLDFDDALKACEFYGKIPFDYLTEEIILDYIFVLKTTYQFEKAVTILKSVITTRHHFGFSYYCLRELVDDSMLCDGAITKSEYLEYKKQLLDLLHSESERIKRK